MHKDDNDQCSEQRRCDRGGADLPIISIFQSLFHEFDISFLQLPFQYSPPSVTILISQESLKVTVAPLLPCTHYTISIKPTAAEGEREQVFTLKKSANKKLALIVHIWQYNYILTFYQITSLMGYNKQ